MSKMKLSLTKKKDHEPLVRQEHVVITFEVTKNDLEGEVREAIESLIGRNFLAVEDTVTWDFYINYFGVVLNQIETVIFLLDTMKVKSLDVKELEHGKILAWELFVKLDALQKKLGERK